MNYITCFTGHRPEAFPWGTDKADLVHPVSTKERRNDAYLDRNKYMVDKSDFVVAIFDDSDPHAGGTWHTLDYAMRKGKIVIKIQWRDIR
ncbi:MAG: hypothetical protein J6J00_10700 [Treponema sp.]|nr:hypothetical protein [Treponema sp.]